VVVIPVDDKLAVGASELTALRHPNEPAQVSAVAGLISACTFAVRFLSCARTGLAALRTGPRGMGGRSHVHSLALAGAPLFCCRAVRRVRRGAESPLRPSRRVVLASGKPAAPPASPFYQQHNLVSDGPWPADLVDPNLVNAWGWFPGPRRRGGSPTTGRGAHAVQCQYRRDPLIVTVPGAGGVAERADRPRVQRRQRLCRDQQCRHEPGAFIFASEDGTISGFRGVPVVIAGTDRRAGRCIRASRTPARDRRLPLREPLSRRHRRRVRQATSMPVT